MTVWIFILFITVFIYKLLFWMYVFQLKEYRYDRFWEYLTTPQGKRALFNVWFFGEVCLYILLWGMYFANISGKIVQIITGIFLLLETIFILVKLVKKQIFLPKITSRLLMLFAGIWLWWGVFFILVALKFPQFYEIFLLESLIFVCVYILMANVLLFPLVHYKKNKIYNKAIEKSKQSPIPITVWITGSYGKSSVKEFLSSILERHGKLLKTPENINTEMGVSHIILREKLENYDYFVAEMGAYKIGEIQTLWNIVNHKYGFLTAIGEQHLALFWGIENTKKAKMEIAHKVEENKGILYVNFDNPNIATSVFSKNLQIVKYGMEAHSLDARSQIIDTKNGNTEFTFSYKNLSHTFTTNLIGKHNILNLTWVLAFCVDIGISLTDLQQDVWKIQLPKNTLAISKKQLENSRECILIDDTYNLSKDWLYAGIEVLHSYKNYKKILVLDDILELGKAAWEIHKQVWEYIATSCQLDALVLVGVNYKQLLKEWLLRWEFDMKKVYEKLPDLQENTVVLFEGRGASRVFKSIE